MRIRRALVAVSVALNALVLAGAAWLAFGGGAAVIGRYFLAPHHEQLVSHFSAFPVAAGDVVFLGDSITEGGRWEETSPARARAIAASAANPVRACSGASISWRAAMQRACS